LGGQPSGIGQGGGDDNGEAQEGNTGNTGTTERRKKRSNTWIWWVIGGYSVSAWLFNMADFVNLYALPQQILENAILEEGVVTQLINPENNDFLASVVGYIAPCLSAPWWEEVLYRGFLLPALSLFMPVWASVFVSGVVFSAHHLSIVAGLPLAVLGWTWAALYMASDNLWSTIAVHALWNSRVFLSSWLGL
jgi:membrane protease YdiL (CAAX protease family)